jgi:hypothetical protein
MLTRALQVVRWQADDVLHLKCRDE